MAYFVPENAHLLEIGPGFGHFTRFLMERTPDITLVELDRGFYEFLKETLHPGVDIHQADFLKFKLDSPKKWTVAANIPYHITSDILLRLLRHKKQVESVFLLMQKEAAERLMADPGTKKYGALSALVQFYSRPEILCSVVAPAFFPAPNVKSVFVKFPLNEKKWEEGFRQFLIALFSARRKTLGYFLKKKEINTEALFGKLDLPHQVRAETLSPETLHRLYEELKSP